MYVILLQTVQEQEMLHGCGQVHGCGQQHGDPSIVLTELKRKDRFEHGAKKQTAVFSVGPRNCVCGQH